MAEELQEFTFIITEEGEGERIDKYLNLLMETLSRSYLQKLLTEQCITVNGKQVKANYRLRTDDQIVLQLPPAVTPDIEPEPIPLSILYEDNDVIILSLGLNIELDSNLVTNSGLTLSIKSGVEHVILRDVRPECAAG